MSSYVLNIFRSKMAYDIVVVGSCNTDLISYVPRLPSLGETILGESFQMGFGGKGANQCIAASRLGASTMMVSKVGNDLFGNQYIDNLKQQRVSTDYIFKSCTSGTGKASINVDKDGHNTIVVVKGANEELSVREIESVEDIIKASKVVVCQMEIRQEVSLAALKLAKKHNVLTVLNPAPAPVGGIMSGLVEHSDVICPNQSEAQSMCQQSFDCADDALKNVSSLSKLGANLSIVTLGKEGCVFQCKNSLQPVLVPSIPVESVDTTGAGDAFVGGLAYCLSKCGSRNVLDLGLDLISNMLEIACQVAAYSVQKKGTQTSFPTFNTLPPSLIEKINALPVSNHMYKDVLP